MPNMYQTQKHEIKENPKSKGSIVILTIILILGIGVIVGGIVFNSFMKNDVKNCTEKTTGIIQSVRKGSDDDAETKIQHDSKLERITYYATVKYTVDDKEYNREAILGSFVKFVYDIDDEVDIVYDEDAPEDFYIESDLKGFASWILYIIGGLAVLICAICIILECRRLANIK